MPEPEMRMGRKREAARMIPTKITPATVRAASGLTISEREFQAAVVELAEWQGWLVYHTHDSRRSAAGFPDLVAVHGQTGELLFAELKTARGRVSPDQRAWLRTLELAAAEKPGVTVKLWRPADWPDVEATLARRSK